MFSSFIALSGKAFSVISGSFNESIFPKEPSDAVPLLMFCAHIIINGDDYKLIVAKHYHFSQLAEKISPAIKGPNQMRKLSSTSIPPESAMTPSFKSGLDVKSMDAALATLPGLSSVRYNQTKPVSGYIRIGYAFVPLDRITAVGDIDSNGFVVYVVSNVAATSRRGAIRLYLMNPNSTYAFLPVSLPTSSSDIS